MVALQFWATAALAEGVPSFVHVNHQPTLKAFLVKNSHYTVAPDSLCDCEDALSSFRKQEPEFQPYYAVGDINDDGIEDFAVGLLKKQKSEDVKPLLTVVIFHGPFSKASVKRGITLFKDYPVTRSQEILSVFKSRIESGFRLPARLDIGPSPFGSDDNFSAHYDWKMKKYVGN